MRGLLSSSALAVLATLAALALGVQGAGGAPAQASTTTVRVQVVGVGTVTDDKNQLSCGNGGTNCRIGYTGTGDVTFTVDPGSGWTFTSWEGCSDPCTVSLDGATSDHELVAQLDQTPLPSASTITVTANGDSGGDGGNVSGGDLDCDTGTSAGCTWSVPDGSTITLVETPDTGFVFASWGGACSGTSRSCTLSVSEDRSVTATFRKPTLTVTVTGNGTVTGGQITCTAAGGSGCTASETAGEEVTLTATPGAGGSFTGWGGACSGTSSVCTVTMSADRTVTATFSGSGPGTAPSTQPLSVSVSGDGTVSGGGLNCGSGGSVCSVNAPAGTTVTLTATPDEGATFTSWGGACSGASRTCALTMSSARSVTATFSGGSSAEVTLSVSVSGRGAVTGGGIRCGNGATACSARVRQSSTVGLTATPAAGGRFAGWGGACSGVVPTCTVEMDEAKSVSARFTSAPGAPAARTGLRSRGRPLVGRTRSGYVVTLRFRTDRGGPARLQARRAGRLETALSFTAPGGAAVIGPFPLVKAGYYVFDLVQAGRSLRWRACLGACGEAAGRKAGPFQLTRGAPTVDEAGALWSVLLHFRSSQPAGIEIRVFRQKRLARELRFPSRAGNQRAGPLLLSPGSYTIRLSATDAFGRSRKLTWVAFLP